MLRFGRRVVVFSLAINVLMGAGQPPEKRKDAQSAYEPRSRPGSGQRYLETFAGDGVPIATEKKTTIFTVTDVQ
jgi:hypothetical protein